MKLHSSGKTLTFLKINMLNWLLRSCVQLPDLSGIYCTVLRGKFHQSASSGKFKQMLSPTLFATTICSAIEESGMFFKLLKPQRVRGVKLQLLMERCEHAPPSSLSLLLLLLLYFVMFLSCFSLPSLTSTSAPLRSEAFLRSLMKSRNIDEFIQLLMIEHCSHLKPRNYVSKKLRRK